MSSIKGGYTPGWAVGEIAYGLTGHQVVGEVSESLVSDSEHAAFTFTTDTGQVFKVTVTTIELSAKTPFYQRKREISGLLSPSA